MGLLFHLVIVYICPLPLRPPLAPTLHPMRPSIAHPVAFFCMKLPCASAARHPSPHPTPTPPLCSMCFAWHRNPAYSLEIVKVDGTVDEGEQSIVSSTCQPSLSNWLVDLR
jgi:hypothetical protein